MVKKFGKQFKHLKEKLYSKLCEEKNSRMFAESLCIFLTTPNEVENMLK